jgi:hypothetical protein
MAAPTVSVRLDDEVRAVLEQDAREHGIGLATYLRDLAGERAKAVRRARIRAESRALGERVQSDAEAGDFYASWGRPSADV